MTRQASDEVIPGRAALSVGDPGSPVPDGWVRTRLTNIARLESGHTPSRKHPEYWGGDVPWVSLPDAREHHGGVIHDTTQKTNEKGLANSAARWLPADTVCLSRTASVGYVFRLGRPMATSQDFVNWVCSRAVDPRFLMYALLAEGEHLLHFGKGTTHTTIYFPEVLAFHLTLAPLAEQRRIVAKVDELLAEVNRAKARLTKVQLMLKRFRQSVFSAACSGELTRDWRATRSTSAAGLDSIRQARQRIFERRTPARSYTPPRALEAADLPALPASWSWARLEEVTDFITKGTTPSSDKMGSTGAIPYIKIHHLGFDGRLHFDAQPVFISRATHGSGSMKRSRVVPGDVLINIVGPPLGQAALVPLDYTECNTNQAIAILRPVDGYSAEFLLCTVLCSQVLEWAISRSKATVGQHNLTLELVRDLPVPIPPSDEQDEIVRRLNGLLRVTEAIEPRVEAAMAHTEKLPQAILAKAFSGELVQTEAELAQLEGRDYEPASALLECVKAESNAIPDRKRTGLARRRSASA